MRPINNKQIKNYSIKEVLDNTFISIIFEFYCTKEPSFITEDFQKMLAKNIILTESDMIPTYSTFVLLKEYGGKRPKYQFKTGYQRYNEIAPTFLNMLLFWINENASLDDSTHMKVKLSYDFNKLETITSISNMDIGKMVLQINEDYIYERFPETKKSPFSMSIKKMFPYNMSSNASHIVNLRSEFSMPISEYYGVDFRDQTMGELTFNYIGGPKYSEKVKEIYEILEYYILTTYQVLNNSEYSSSLVNELNKLTEEFRKFRKCYYDYEKFVDVYKDIEVYVDLNKGPLTVEAYWFKIRDVLAKLILESNVKKCKFNLDTDVGVYQIKDAKITNSKMSEIFLVNSTVSGVFENCYFWNCKIENSRIKSCSFFNRNEIKNCHLERSRIDESNKVEDSYIVNTGEIVNCEVNNCIIKNAGIGEKAKLDEKCLIVGPHPKTKEKEIKSIENEEIRDYRWIKSLRDPNYKDKGFENEYKEE
jgi:hypothetical protein